jgi:hypothetical protein
MIGLGGERRDHWDPALMPDQRVLHYWGAKRFAGPWFAKEVEGKLGYTWDTYFLYGPDATWDALTGRWSAAAERYWIPVRSCGTSWRLLSRNSVID